MDIKKLIREEIDDFDWMEKASDHLSFEHLKGKGLEFNPPIEDEGYFNKVREFLVDVGFSMSYDWSETQQSDYYEDEYLEGISGLYMANLGKSGNWRVIWTSEDTLVNEEETYQAHISDFANKPVEVLNGRNLLSHL